MYIPVCVFQYYYFLYRCWPCRRVKMCRLKLKHISSFAALVLRWGAGGGGGRGRDSSAKWMQSVPVVNVWKDMRNRAPAFAEVSGKRLIKYTQKEGKAQEGTSRHTGRAWCSSWGFSSKVLFHRVVCLFVCVWYLVQSKSGCWSPWEIERNWAGLTTKAEEGGGGGVRRQC